MPEGWHSAARPTRLLGGIILGIAAAYALAFAGFYIGVDHRYPDFFGFWSFARFALSDGFPALYDNRALEAYEYATGLVPPGYFPYLYPPPFLLVLLPLAKLPYLVARLAWIAITGAAFVAAVCAGKDWRPWMVIAALACPTTVIAAAYGQNGFLIAALMLGGLRCLGARDFRAGLLLGAVSLKPQFFILVPIAIVAYGSWRVFFGAVTSSVALVLASAALFGPGMWFAWITRMQTQFGAMSTGWAEQITSTPTVTAAILLAGGDAMLAHMAQFVAALLVAIALWRGWRAGREKFRMAARALLPVGTFLGTPYAFNYDLPIISGAILLVIAERTRAAETFTFAEILLFAATLMAPMLLTSAMRVAPILMCAALALLFWQLARHAAGGVRETTPPRRPKIPQQAS